VPNTEITEAGPPAVTTSETTVLLSLALRNGYPGPRSTVYRLSIDGLSEERTPFLRNGSPDRQYMPILLVEQTLPTEYRPRLSQEAPHPMCGLRCLTETNRL